MRSELCQFYVLGFCIPAFQRFPVPGRFQWKPLLMICGISENGRGFYKLWFVFKELEQSCMWDCPLQNITAMEIPQQFLHLRVLDLHDTLLDTWEPIDAQKASQDWQVSVSWGCPIQINTSTSFLLQGSLTFKSLTRPPWQTKNGKMLSNFSFVIIWMMKVLYQGILS